MKVAFEKYGYFFRTVEMEDASKIVSLRCNSKLGKYLNNTENNIEKQIQWLEKYFENEQNGNEYYFAISDLENNVLGFNRLYNIKDNYFELGSWIFDIQAPSGAAILGDLAVRDYAFEILKLEYCTFEVRKSNKSVVNYHLKFSPEKLGEDDLNYYFRLNYVSYRKHRDVLLKILL